MQSYVKAFATAADPVASDVLELDFLRIFLAAARGFKFQLLLQQLQTLSTMSFEVGKFMKDSSPKFEVVIFLVCM